MGRRSGHDILARLCQAHDELREMAERLDQAADEDLPAWVARLRDAVSIHATLEEEILLPAFTTIVDSEEGEVMAQADADEHAFILRLLDEALRVPPGSLSFHEDLLLAREALQRHVDQEEDEMFPRVERAFSQEFLADLGRRVQQRTEVLRRQHRRRQHGPAPPGLQRRVDRAREGMSKTELIRQLRRK